MDDAPLTTDIGKLVIGNVFGLNTTGMINYFYIESIKKPWRFRSNFQTSSNYVRVISRPKITRQNIRLIIIRIFCDGLNLFYYIST